MIIAYIQGGLGNQLFQYAAALSLANKLGTKLVIDRSWFQSNAGTPRTFILDTLFSPLEYVSKKDARLLTAGNDSWYHRIQKRLAFGKLGYFHDTEGHECFHQLKGNIFLEGNFQSYHYHNDLPAAFFEVFRSYQSGETFNQLAQLIQSKPFASVHIRRGDYVTDAKTNNLHGSMPVEYYVLAMQQLKAEIPELNFLVFSDDKKFVEEKFSGESYIKIVNEKNLSDTDELMLMSQCRHHIIANSSFSWWAAYLGQNPAKKIMYPAHWYRTPPKDFKLEELIPANWQKIG